MGKCPNEYGLCCKDHRKLFDNGFEHGKQYGEVKIALESMLDLLKKENTELTAENILLKAKKIINNK